MSGIQRRSRRAAVPFLWALPLLTLLLFGCDAGSFVEPTAVVEPTPTGAAQVRATPHSHTFGAAGETLQAQAEALDSYGNTVSDVSFDWTSTNTSTATVDSTGLVTVKSAGTALVIVTAIGFAAADTISIDVQEALAAGTATATAGDGRVTLFATGPTGGTPPYTYQWHRSTTSGFAPGTGTAVAGLAALSGTDTGLNNGTTYYYVLQVKDADGEAVDHAEVSATPNTTTAIFTDSFDAYADGSSLQGEGSGGFSWGGTTWMTGAGRGPSTVLARTGQKSLRFRWRQEENLHSAEQRFNFPPGAQEHWVEYYMYFPDGTESDGEGGTLNRFELQGPGQQKFYTVYSPNASFQLYESVDTDGDARLTLHAAFDMNGKYDYLGIGWTPDQPDTWDGDHRDLVGAGDRGRWMQIRVSVRVSDPGLENGHFKVWKDGTQVVDVRNIGNEDRDDFNDALREGYLMGWKNNPSYAVDTSVFIDDFAFYTNDPGW